MSMDLHPGPWSQAQHFRAAQPWSAPRPGAALCLVRLVLKPKPVLIPTEEGLGC